MTVTTDGEEEAALTAYSYEKKVQVASFSNFFLDFLILSLALPCHLSGELKGNGR